MLAGRHRDCSKYKGEDPKASFGGAGIYGLDFEVLGWVDGGLAGFLGWFGLRAFGSWLSSELAGVRA